MPELEEDASEIALHLPFLEELASYSAVILELGVGKGNGSARAFARGLERSPKLNKLYVSVDFDRNNPLEHQRPALPYWRIVYGRTEDPATAAEALEIINGRKIDILFIDTHHTYEQMAAELALWSTFASPETLWVFHDTYMFGAYNTMTDAIKEWAAANPGWEYIDHTLDSHGLGLMRRSGGQWNYVSPKAQ